MISLTALAAAARGIDLSQRRWGILIPSWAESTVAALRQLRHARG